MPNLHPDEFQELKGDIAARGVMVAIEFDEEGNILDGHHRLRACQELGITSYPTIVRSGLTEAEKRLHIRKINGARRHLNQEQKRELVRDQLAETPQMSNRYLASEIGVSDKTVASIRRDMESSAEIPQLSARVGADGKMYSSEAVRVDTDIGKSSDQVDSGAEFPHVESRADAEARPIAMPWQASSTSVTFTDEQLAEIKNREAEIENHRCHAEKVREAIYAPVKCHINEYSIASYLTFHGHRESIDDIVRMCDKAIAALEELRVLFLERKKIRRIK